MVLFIITGYFVFYRVWQHSKLLTVINSYLLAKIKEDKHFLVKHLLKGVCININDLITDWLTIFVSLPNVLAVWRYHLIYDLYVKQLLTRKDLIKNAFMSVFDIPFFIVLAFLLLAPHRLYTL